MTIGYGSLPWCNVDTKIYQSSSITFIPIGSFRLDYEYEIEYEYDFRISNQ